MAEPEISTAMLGKTISIRGVTYMVYGVDSVRRT